MSSGGANKGTYVPHPQTDEIILLYLHGKGHKDVARLTNVPYTTCVDISKKYLTWVPVLKKPLPSQQRELPLDEHRKRTYKSVPPDFLTLESET